MRAQKPPSAHRLRGNAPAVAVGVFRAAVRHQPADGRAQPGEGLRDAGIIHDAQHARAVYGDAPRCQQRLYRTAFLNGPHIVPLARVVEIPPRQIPEVFIRPAGGVGRIAAFPQRVLVRQKVRTALPPAGRISLRTTRATGRSWPYRPDGNSGAGALRCNPERCRTPWSWAGCCCRPSRGRLSGPAARPSVPSAAVVPFDGTPDGHPDVGRFQRVGADISHNGDGAPSCSAKANWSGPSGPKGR